MNMKYGQMKNEDAQWDEFEMREEAMSEEKENIEEKNCMEADEYTEEGQHAEGGYYTEDGQYVEGGYYTEDGQYVEGGYYTEDGRYAEESYYAGEEEESAPVLRRDKGIKSKPDGKKRQEDAGFLAAVCKYLAGMDVMDKVMVVTGVFVLVLAIVTGSLFISSRQEDEQISAFAEVGAQLEQIAVIGGEGIQAVAAAKVARLEGSYADDGNGGSDGNYGEGNYDRTISVVPHFTSIQKDLKIKFLNQKTDKLVANVPFSVVVTGPDGKSKIWSDDDMDGIIYKKDIEAGTYKVVMEKLSDAKYGEYIVATSEKTTEVRDKITYAKVDVSNEVIEESEIDASKEDTKKNEVVVESTIQNTVQWVESKVIPSTYNEVAKSTIPNPTTLVYARSLFLTGQDSVSGGNATAEPTATPTAEPTATPTVEPTAEPTATPTAEPTATPTAGPTATPTAGPSATPTAGPTATPTTTPSASPSPTPTVTPAPVKGSVKVNSTTLTGIVGTTLSNQASVSGFTAGSKIVYSISGNNAQVASAIIDNNGKITVSALTAGTVTFTVTANYEKGTAQTQGSTTFSVTVGAKKTIALDSTNLTVFMQEPKTVTATIGNALAKDITVTATSSDTGIAQVTVDKTKVTVTGIAEGSAVVTIQYTENGETVTATCQVTIKKHPSTDTVTLLKDSQGRQLYVMENNTYRQATHADYYTADKFFICGEAKYTGWQMLNGKMYFFDANGNKVTGQQTIQGATYNFAEDGSLVTGSGSVGIDVSKWNGNIDWDAVANSGISYVIIRCGYRGSSNGKLVVDPTFEKNIKGATRAGLKIGIYFFSQAIDEVEAVEEASMVLDLIEGYKITYPVFLDVETSGGRGDKINKDTRTAVCKAFCETIQSEGYMPGVYSNKQWLEKKLDAGALEEYKIWLAQYAASPTYTGVYDMWQYTAKGNVNGISGDVDLNISYMGY